MRAQSSGVGVNAACLDKFQELKLGKSECRQGRAVRMLSLLLACLP